MIFKSEQLLEVLLDLERSRQREQRTRIEAESMLQGLRGISAATDHQELFLSLVGALRKVIPFEHAFILEMRLDNRMTALVSTLEAIRRSEWIPGSLFSRVLAGRPIASYDVSLVPEWKDMPSAITTRVTSALHIGLHGGGWKAILVITHPEARHFGPSHVKKAMRFSPLAAQAFLTLELQQTIIQRDRFFQLSLDVMAIVDISGLIKQGNDGWAGILGYEAHDIHGKSIFSFIHPDDLPFFQEVLGILKKNDGRQLIEARFLVKHGGERWLSCSVASYKHDGLFYVVARDVTDRVLYEKRLAHQAGHDGLTGLKNRAEFMTILHAACREASRGKGYHFSICFLDLNKFKLINDTYGHDAGDELLKFFARTLQEAVRDGDIVARLGGDEFIVLLDNVEDEETIGSIVARIHRKCAQSVSITGHEMKVSTSIGVATSCAGFADEEAMLKAADQAMYQAKSDSSRQYVIALC